MRHAWRGGHTGWVRFSFRPVGADTTIYAVTRRGAACSPAQTGNAKLLPHPAKIVVGHRTADMLFCRMVFEELEPGDEPLPTLRRLGGFERRHIAEHWDGLVEQARIVPVQAIVDHGSLFVRRESGG